MKQPRKGGEIFFKKVDLVIEAIMQPFVHTILYLYSKIFPFLAYCASIQKFVRSITILQEP